MTQEYYKLKKLIGKGSFATAYLVQNFKKQLCVLKQINLASLSQTQKQATMQEPKILQKMNHPNIIKYIQSYQVKSNKLIIIAQYAQNGTLLNYLNSINKKLCQNQILDWITQMALALSYLHKRNIVHRDIKLCNIFLSKKLRIKLGDFGLSQILQKNRFQKSGLGGTPYYIAPQVIISKRFGTKCDIWGLGVVSYYLCTKKLPFDGSNMDEIFDSIINGYFQPIQGYSKQLSKLIYSLLTSNLQNRPTASDILNLDIIKRRIGEFIEEESDKVKKDKMSQEQKSVYYKDIIKQMEVKQHNVSFQRLKKYIKFKPRQEKNSFFEQRCKEQVGKIDRILECIDNRLKCRQLML